MADLIAGGREIMGELFRVWRVGIVAALFVTGSSLGWGQLPLTTGALPLELQINPVQSNLNVTIAIDSILDDSDSDSSSIQGTLNATYGIDFDTGNLRVTNFQFTGGQVALTNSMAFDLDISFITPIFSADITTSNIAGVPSTPETSILSIPARPGTTGLYAASDHVLTLNQGTIVATGDLNETIDLATQPISGSSNSSTPGEVIVTQGVIDLEANTTSYTMTTILPVGVQEVQQGSASGVNYTVTITGTGSARATSTTFTFDFIPWNGIAGDINQDGVLSYGTGDPATDDVAAFVAGWRSTNTTPGLLAYQLGDLNFDGKTDLHDAFLLRSALKDQGATLDLATLLGPQAVPEPASLVLFLGLVLATGGLSVGRFKR